MEVDTVNATATLDEAHRSQHPRLISNTNRIEKTHRQQKRWLYDGRQHTTGAARTCC